MTATWTTMPANQVRPGATVRLASGQQLQVSEIESPFLGMPGMIAFIEETATSWLKQPLPEATEVEVLQS